MAERSGRRRGLLGSIAATVAVASVVCAGSADAVVRHRHDPGHDVVVSNPGSFRTRPAPHVRADDLVDLRADYRPHHLTTTFSLRGRDRYSDEVYALAFGSRRGLLVALVDTSPLAPKGDVFSMRDPGPVVGLGRVARLHRLARQARATQARECTGIRVALHPRSVSVTVPDWCFGRPHRVAIVPWLDRTKGSRDYSDDGSTLWVRRG